jgi:hypothetical protein
LFKTWLSSFGLRPTQGFEVWKLAPVQKKLFQRSVAPVLCWTSPLSAPKSFIQCCLRFVRGGGSYNVLNMEHACTDLRWNTNLYTPVVYTEDCCTFASHVTVRLSGNLCLRSCQVRAGDQGSDRRTDMQTVMFRRHKNGTTQGDHIIFWGTVFRFQGPLWFNTWQIVDFSVSVVLCVCNGGVRDNIPDIQRLSLEYRTTAQEHVTINVPQSMSPRS